MRRLPALALAVYAPHLLEEHASGMANDPLIVRALAPLAATPAREASYLVFQLTFALALAMLAMHALGGRARAIVYVGLGLALIAESHHLVRALATLEWNAGLATALPMPFVGLVLLRAVATSRPGAAVVLEGRAANARSTASTRR